MAEQLIEGLTKAFDPEAYPNETRRGLLEFLEAKAAGQELPAVEEAPEPAPVVDLMAALKASLSEGDRKPASRAGKKADEAQAEKKGAAGKAASTKRKKAASG